MHGPIHQQMSLAQSPHACKGAPQRPLAVAHRVLVPELDQTGHLAAKGETLLLRETW